jgi:alpha-galactosidase
MISPTDERLKEYNIHRTSHADRVRKRQDNLDYARQMVAGKIKMPPRSRETAVDMVLAISKNRPFIDVVNRPNEGQVENLPRGVVVETLGIVDALGFRPIAQGPMPPALAGLVEPHCRVQQMTLEAALKGDKKLAIEALMIDPQCWHLRPAQVRKMAGELMEATADYLRQFKSSPRRR